MIANIPNKYTMDSLMCEINSKGHQEKYDFFYVPIDQNVMFVSYPRTSATKGMLS